MSTTSSDRQSHPTDTSNSSPFGEGTRQAKPAGGGASVVIIDNYDSFTYNLAHLVRELGATVSVVRNDQFRLPDLAAYDKILLSPGPGIPTEAGLLMDVIREYADKKPMLGVCLGHQAIGEAFGAKLENLAEVYHGVATDCEHFDNDPLFAGLPRHFQVGRYHSWVVSKDGFPDSLEVTAVSPDGHIMGLRHKQFPVHGIQFHPESVLTPLGRQIVANWLSEKEFRS